MKLKCSLLAVLFVFTVMNVQNSLAQSAPSNPKHDEIDKEILKLDDTVNSIEPELVGDWEDSYYSYYPGVFAICNEKANGLIVDVKKNEDVEVVLKSSSSASQCSVTQSNPTVASKLMSIHQETISKTWYDYLDETPINSASIQPTFQRYDVFLFKATQAGSTTLEFATSTPSVKDPSKPFIKKVSIEIIVSE
ncbi:MAG: hypothetical protein QE493_02430 [Verrucomicrobiae bacterium]|nr:hypothetical protein [Verrucomicrobiae bacterium]